MIPDQVGSSALPALGEDPEPGERSIRQRRSSLQCSIEGGGGLVGDESRNPVAGASFGLGSSHDALHFAEIPGDQGGRQTAEVQRVLGSRGEVVEADGGHPPRVGSC